MELTADINTSEEAREGLLQKPEHFVCYTQRGMYNTTFYISFSITGNMIGVEYIFQNLFGSLSSGMP